MVPIVYFHVILVDIFVLTASIDVLTKTTKRYNCTSIMLLCYADFFKFVFVFCKSAVFCKSLPAMSTLVQQTGHSCRRNDEAKGAAISKDIITIECSNNFPSLALSWEASSLLLELPDDIMPAIPDHKQ